jgi:membrane protease YdiL (CAAX protease family)
MNEPFPRLDDTTPPKPARQRVPWGVKEMVICTVIVVIALFVISTAVVGPFILAFGEDSAETLSANSASNILWNAAMIGAVLFFIRRGGGTIRDLGLSIPEGMTIARIAGLAALTFLTMYILVAVYTQAIDLFGLDFLQPDQQVPDAFYDSDLALAILGVAIVISAPITEEIFFRGFLFGGTRPLVVVAAAALITGLIFSLAHYNLGLIIPFTAVGAILALSYQRTGTLFVPIGAHFLFNLVSFAILVFVPDARP